MIFYTSVDLLDDRILKLVCVFGLHGLMIVEGVRFVDCCKHYMI